MPQSDHDLTSHRLEILRAALAAAPDSEVVLAEFWQHAAETGTPFIEHISTEKHQALVTFVWRETSPTATVHLSESASYRSPSQRALSRLPGTDVWHLSWWVDLSLRVGYGFVVQPEGEAPAGDLRHAPPAPDPLNQHNVHSDWELDEIDSVLVMPNATPLPWIAPRDQPIRGTLHHHTFASSILGNERPIWVYTPPDHSATGEPYPFVVIFDGEAFHSGPRVLDALITAGEIPPMVAILVNQIGIRNQELTCNPDFSQSIATELVPWARAAFHLSADPALAALNGRSFGGLCSAFTALKHPDVFGNAFLQSASCWYHPELPLREAPSAAALPAPVGTPASIPSIIAAYMAEAPAPIRIFQECGSVENGPPIARVWQIFGNRWFHDVLALKGYDTLYREFSGGHDDAWWRGTFADGIRWIFGPQPE